MKKYLAILIALFLAGCASRPGLIETKVSSGLGREVVIIRGSEEYVHRYCLFAFNLYGAEHIVGARIRGCNIKPHDLSLPIVEVFIEGDACGAAHERAHSAGYNHSQMDLAYQNDRLVFDLTGFHIIGSETCGPREGKHSLWMKAK